MIAGIGFKSTVTITSFNELFESYICLLYTSDAADD